MPRLRPTPSSKCKVDEPLSWKKTRILWQVARSGGCFRSGCIVVRAVLRAALMRSRRKSVGSQQLVGLIVRVKKGRDGEGKKGGTAERRWQKRTKRWLGTSEYRLGT
eukprot:1395247-Rhodomonas_salina.2